MTSGAFKSLIDAKIAIGRMQCAGRLPVLPGVDYRHLGDGYTDDEIEELLADSSGPKATASSSSMFELHTGNKVTPTCYSLMDLVARAQGKKVTSQEKKVTSRNRKSRRRDRETIRILRRSADKLTEAEEVSSVITRGSTCSLDSDDVPLGLSGTEPSFAPWDDTTDELKIAIAERVILSDGGGAAFTLHLGHEIWAQAQSQSKGPCDFIRRRVSRYLQRGLGHPIEFWFAIEKSPKGTPHLHGAVETDVQQLRMTMKALEAVAGNVPREFKAYVLDMKQLTAGWADYACKGLSHSSGDTRVACTRRLKARARELYNRERDLALKAQNR